MLKMKLPLGTGETGGEQTGEGCCCYPEKRLRVPGKVLDKESVFQWFGLQLDPARRIQFMCGLLHMCQPLELRFLGSYLEDLARKDYHVLREAENRANNPGDLSSMTDPLDPVIRSKLLVCLSLLQSDNRECAGVLFRILGQLEPGIFLQGSPLQAHFLRPSQSQSPGAGQPLEQLALLFTMASLHPAFHFHQREVVREQLDRIELVLEEEEKRRTDTEAPDLSSLSTDYLTTPPLGLTDSSASRSPCQTRRSTRWTPQREAVHIEGIMLRGVSRTRVDREYNFEVKWSDSSSSCVTKTHLELENFLLKLPKDQCTESFKKSILRLLNQRDQYDQYDGLEVESSLRDRFLSAPPLFRKTRKVCSFFTTDSSSSRPPGCRCQCQLGPAYQDCSDASSQDEESYIQGHKKKPGAKSPSQPAKVSQDVRRPLSAELNGPTERRKKSSSVRSSHEEEQEKRSHAHNLSRGLPVDREQTGSRAAPITNGGLSPAAANHRTGPPTAANHMTAVASGRDAFGGETSSESYSSPSSPQHAESLDSEDDHHKDSDSQSDDASKAEDCFSRQHMAPPNVLPSNVLPLSSSPAPLCPDGRSDFPPLSFLHSLPYLLPGRDSSLPLPSPPLVPDGVSSPSPMMASPSSPSPSPSSFAAGESEKREAPPSFGGPGLPPLVQRFKTVPHVPGGGDGCPGGGGGAIRAMGILPSGSSSPLLPPQDLTDAPPVKHGAASLPSGLPLAYCLAAAPPTGLSVGGSSTGLAPPNGLSVGGSSTGLAPPTGLSVGGSSTAVAPSAGLPPSTCLHAAPPTGLPPSSGLPPSAGLPAAPSTGLPPSTGLSAGGLSTGLAPPTGLSAGGLSTGLPPGGLSAGLAPPSGLSAGGLSTGLAPPSGLPPSTGLPPPSGLSAVVSLPAAAPPAGHVSSCVTTPAPSLSPAHSDSPAPCGGAEALPPQPPQQPISCGACGCHNNCGGRGNGGSSGVGGGGSGCQTPPLFFPAHQMAAVARQMFSVAPPLFQLTNLCSSSYLGQANAAALQSFFPSVPPPPPYLHGHAHSHADVPAHMLSQPAVAVAAAAAGYGLQQQVAPASSFCQQVYQQVFPNSLGLHAASIAPTKKNAKVSCYNCGVSGHYAQDCSQPGLDASQQGGFRLKYTPSHASDSLDNAD